MSYIYKQLLIFIIKLKVKVTYTRLWDSARVGFYWLGTCNRLNIFITTDSLLDCKKDLQETINIIYSVATIKQLQAYAFNN